MESMKVLKTIPINSIVPDPAQPRQQFDEAGLKELAESIRENGLIQPIEVEELADGHYLLHHGERRWRACKMAGKKDIWCIVAPALDGEARLLRGVIENLHRQDLTLIEEAQAYKRLLDAGWAKIRIARMTTKSIATISSRLIWLELAPEIQQYASDGKLARDAAVAKALLSVRNEEARLKLARQLATHAGGQSIRTVVSACKKVRLAIKAEQTKTGRKAADDLKPAKGVARSLAIALDGASTPPDEQKLGGWESVRKVVKATCNGCSLRELTRSADEPAWWMVARSAELTCRACEMNNLEMLSVCRDCPVTDLVKRVIDEAQDKTE